MDWLCDDADGSVPEAQRDAWDGFVRSLAAGHRVEVWHGSDVDSLCAAAVAAGGLGALGFSVVFRRGPIPAGEGEGPRLDVTRAPERTGAFALVTAADPAEGARAPVLAWRLWMLLEEHCSMEAFAWLAAVPLLERHGVRGVSPFLKVAKTRYTAKFLRHLLTWCELAPHGECDLTDVMLQALCTHRDPRALINGKDTAVAELRAAEAAITLARLEANGATPHLAGHLALIRMRSPCQVQSLVAAEWSGRLPGYVVMVANEGDDRVGIATFSASPLEMDDFLGSLALPADFVAHGQVSVPTWHEVLRTCGASVGVY